MDSWKLFLSYAKSDPINIPKSIKERSKIYRNYKELCHCGKKTPMCATLNIKNVCGQHKSAYDINKDAYMLQAKIKAYEDILADKDKEIESLMKSATIKQDARVKSA